MFGDVPVAVAVVVCVSSLLMDIRGANDFQTPCRNPVADLEEGPEGVHPLFWVKRTKSQKEEKVDRGSKTKLPPTPLAQGLDPHWNRDEQKPTNALI